MNEKGTRSLSWIFYTFILPILFTLIIVFLIVQFMLGINVTGAVSTWAVQVPVIRHALGLAPIEPPVSEQVKRLSTAFSAEELEVTDLKQKISLLQSKIVALQNQDAGALSQYQLVKKQLKAEQVAMHRAQNESAIYTNMSPSQAAQIIVQLPFAQEVLVLKAMDAGTSAQILAQLPVKQAAKLLQSGA